MFHNLQYISNFRYSKDLKARSSFCLTYNQTRISFKISHFLLFAIIYFIFIYLASNNSTKLIYLCQNVGGIMCNLKNASDVASD